MSEIPLEDDWTCVRDMLLQGTPSLSEEGANDDGGVGGWIGGAVCLFRLAGRSPRTAPGSWCKAPARGYRS